MNWQEIAGNLVSLVKNSDLKKDTIDLFEKQLALLKDKIAVLEHNLEVSETKRANLQAKVADLEQQLENLYPKGKPLHEISKKILKCLAREGRAPSLEQSASELGIKEVEALHYANLLVKAGMIELVGFSPQYGTMYSLTEDGAAYVVENGLLE